MTTPNSLPPGSTIGIIGGGQLGRMAALAAARLGYRVHVFCPEADSPTEQVAAAATVAEYTDLKALEAFARAVDVVTFEFENIPAESVRVLSDLVPVRPGWKVLEVAQDRITEKTFFNSIGIETAPWAKVTSAAELKDAVAHIGRLSAEPTNEPNAAERPLGVLKTTRFGYDGKGQVKITADTDLAEAWAALNTNEAILEGFVDFAGEISVIVARGLDGASATFDPAWNVHTNHILDTTTIPAPIPRVMAEAAMEAAHKVAKELELVGLLAVEMFVAKDGRLLANEMAPRPHNSGHWTIDACITDQFEQFIRAVCGLPLGSPERHSDAIMKNLIGDDVHNWPDILKDPVAKLHLYGKSEARSGRKMGHVTHLSPRKL